MSTKSIDYYFFVVSPFAYLGHARFAEIARRAGASIQVRPINAAKVFPASGGVPLKDRPPQRRAYRMTELARWREFTGVPMHLEPKFFPAPGDAASRLIIAAEERSKAAAFDLAGRVLAAVWAQERNIADEATLQTLADEAELDGAALLARSGSPEIQARYDHYTQQAIERQVFGSPTYVYRDELFWGQDRLDFLERALAR